jgi:integrase
VRGLVRALWDYAMWRGEIPTQRNPMELVTIKGATKRGRKPRSLTVEEFQKFVRELEEPVCTIALVCVCFGLRISECLGLKWSDVDWLNSALSVERSIVRQRVGDVKTIYSGEGRTATKAFRKRDLPTDQAQAQQPEWDVPQWGCSDFRNRSTAR